MLLFFLFSFEKFIPDIVERGATEKEFVYVQFGKLLFLWIIVLFTF